MTVGQRIAQKRKELGLSQEALGEQLGVSRQSIYKWESDTVLPEVEKLIALSRLFSVSVGWLLGVEEDAQPEPSPDLTPEQLAMVKEIVEQYLAALPRPEGPQGGGPEGAPADPDDPAAPQRPRRRRWPRVLAALACLALVVALFNLFDRLNRVTQDYQSLQNSIQNVQYTVNSQIGSITDRVESILQSQNELTAEYHTQHLSNDLAANTATFEVYAVPKTYQPGMTAVFQARSGGDTVELTVTEPDGNNAFSGMITCPLTDDITLSVVFVTGDKEETQWLEDWDYLYSSSFPMLNFWGGGLFFEEEDGTLPAHEEWEGRWEGTEVEAYDWNSGAELDIDDMDLQVGLFRDRELIQWYEKRTVERNVNGQPTQVTLWSRTQAVTLEPGHEYTEAILYTDEYGRQRMYPDGVLVYDEADGTWGGPGAYTIENDPAAWEF